MASNVEIVITGRGSSAKAAIDDVKNALGGLKDTADQAGGGIRGSLQRIGEGAAAFLTAQAVPALLGMGSQALSVATSYESAMNMMQAVSGATASQMAAVGARAKELGADMTLPATSAGDAAAAMTELVKAGLSVEEAMTAAKGALQLSAAGQISNADAAAIAANALNAWRNAAGGAALTSADATRVADMLAAAANSSSSSVNDLALSLKQSAASAASAGIPIQDLMSAIALMSNAGIAGSDAGTSLKTMIMSLQAPSDSAAATMQALGISVFDSAGNMRSMESIIGQFSGKLGGLTQEQRNQALATIFGSDAIRAANIVLMGGVAAFDSMGQAVGRQGAAAALAGAQMQGLGGAVQGMKSQIETALLTLTEPALPFLTGIVNQISAAIPGIVGQVQGLGKQIGQALASFQEGFAAGGVGRGSLDLLMMLGLDMSAAAKVASVISQIASTIQSGISQIQGVVQTLGPVFGGLSGIIATTSGALAGVAVAAAGLTIIPAIMGGAAAAVAGVGAALAFLISPIGLVIASAAVIGAAYATNFGGMRDSVNQVAGVLGGIFLSALQTVGQIGATVLGALPGLFGALAGPAQTIVGLVGSVLTAAFTSLGSIAQSVFSVLPGNIGVVMSVLTSLASLVGGVLAGAFSVVAPIAVAVFQGVASAVGLAMPGIAALVSAVGSMLVTAFNGLQAVAVSVFSAIQPYIPMVQAAIMALGGVVGSILGTAFSALAGLIQGSVVPAISTAATWLASNLPTAINVVMGFVTGTLLPGLVNLGIWLASNLPTAIQTLSGFWSGTLLPAIQAVGGWIAGTLVPILGQVVGWLASNLPTAISGVSAVWTGTLLPALQNVGNWIVGTLIPTLGQVAGWLASNLPTAIQTLSGFWSGTLLPALQGVWGFISESLWPLLQSLGNLLSAVVGKAVEALAGLWENVLAPALSKVWDFISGDLIPGLGRLAGMAKDVAGPAIDGFAGLLRSAERAFAGVKGAIDTVIGGINSFAEAIRGVQLPDFLQRHSPSPLEQTFMGLASSIPAAGAALSGFAGQASGMSGAAGAVSLLAQASRELFNIFSEESAGIGGNAPKKLKRLTDSVSAISEAVQDLLAMVTAIQGFKLDKLTGGLLGDSGFETQLVATITRLADLSHTIALAVKPIAAGIGKSIPDDLKVLGDAAGAAVGIANNAMGLVKALAAAINEGLDGFDLARGTAAMTALTERAAAWVAAAAPAALSILNVDTRGLAPLKTATETTLGIATSAFGLAKTLADALAYDWTATNWGRARDMMAGLTTLAVFFVTAASAAALAILDIDTRGLGPVKTATETALGIATNAFSLAKVLGDALAYDWTATNWGRARDMMGGLTTLAVFFVRAAAAAALAILDIDTSGLAPLKTATESVIGIADGALKLVSTFLGMMQDRVTIPDPAQAGLAFGQLAAWAAGVANAANLAAGALQGQTAPAGVALSNALKAVTDAITSALKLLDDLRAYTAANAQPPSIILGTMAYELGGWAAGVANAFNFASQNLQTNTAPAGVTLSNAIKTVTEAISAALKLLDDLRAYAAANAQPPSILLGTLAYEVGWWAAGVANAFNLAVQNLQSGLAPGGLVLAGAIKGALEGISAALSMLALLVSLNTNLPELPSVAAGSGLAGFITDVVAWAMDVTRIASTAAAPILSIDTAGLAPLRTAIGNTLGGLTDTFKIIETVNGYLRAGGLSLDVTAASSFVEKVIGWAVTLTQAFIRGANQFTGQAGPAVGDFVKGLDQLAKVVDDFSKFQQKIGAIETLEPAALETLKQKVTDMVSQIGELTKVFLTGANAFSGQPLVGAENLTKGIDQLQKVVSDVKSSLKALTEMQLEIPEGTEAQVTAVVEMAKRLVTLFFTSANATPVGAQVNLIQQINEMLGALGSLGRLGEIAQGAQAGMATLMTALVETSAAGGLSAGTSFIEQFAAAITAGAGLVQGALAGVLAGAGGGNGGNGAGEQGSAAGEAFGKSAARSAAASAPNQASANAAPQVNYTVTYNTVNVTINTRPEALADAHNSILALRAAYTTGL